MTSKPKNNEIQFRKLIQLKVLFSIVLWMICLEFDKTNSSPADLAILFIFIGLI